MSKVVKQMEMDAMKQTFKDVRDLVVISPKGVSAGLDHGLRTSLRKKNIRLMMVKNSLCRRVFKELGMKVPDDSPYWANTTWVAWGPESVGELSKEIDKAIVTDAKFKDKFTIKGAICEGSPMDYEISKTVPTRPEALGRIAALILGPGGQLAAAIAGPGGQLASQVKSKGEGEEKKDEAAPAA